MTISKHGDQNPPREEGLDHVRPIEVVHAIGPDYPHLKLGDRAVGVHFKIAHVFQLLIGFQDQLGEVLPLPLLLALAMEVEPNVLDTITPVFVVG